MFMRNARIALVWLTFGTVVTLLIAAPKAAVAGDPAAGRSVFQSNCSICHSVQPDQNKIGPTLFDLVGRKTGAITGYSYSTANQNANITWTDATLDKYLESPRGVIPGTKMAYAGVKDAEKRANLISYLDTLK